MYWILAAILLIVMLAVPKLRPVALVGLVILGAMLGWGMLGRFRDPAQQPERGRPTTPAAALSAFPVDQVQLQNLELSGGGAPFSLTGRVGNGSAHLLLKSMMLDITRRDCHEGALDESGCALLWQTRQWIDLSVPPREERNIAVSIWARGDAPRAAGTVRDEFKIVTANGQAVEVEKK
jgi:hypothetical protein